MAESAWTVARASVKGTSHNRNGMPCQDHAAVAFLPSGSQEVLAIAVCDGAGSAAHSDIGSQLAAEWFLQQVELYLEDDGVLGNLTRSIVLSWLNETQRYLASHAAEFERLPRDYSCTLLCAIVSPNDAVFMQVGDGAIVVSHGGDDGWSYLFWPQHGEFANSTNFIQSSQLPELLEFSYEPRTISDLAIFSDGIENLVLHKSSKTVHGPFFERNVKPLRSSRTRGIDIDLSRHLISYLESPVICEKTDDDKTLVMATRCRTNI